MMLTGILLVAAIIGHQKLDNRSWETHQLQRELCFPPGNNTGGVTNGQTGLPGRLGTALPSSGNNTGTPGKTNIFNPIGNATNIIPGNSSTSALPPGSIFKVPPGTTNALPLPGNTTNGSIARLGGASSPTGYCARTITTSCIPCDPGLPGGKETCIPTSQWPPSASLPLTGNATNPGNNPGTITKVLPGIFKPTGNASNATPPPTIIAKQPSSSHHHHKGQTSTSSSNTNSTGH